MSKLGKKQKRRKKLNRNISFTPYKRLNHNGSMSHPLSLFRVDSVFRIQSASFTFRLRQRFSLSITFALIQSSRWPSTMAWSAAADRSTRPCRACARCSATLTLVVLPVSPMYAASQSWQWMAAAPRFWPISEACASTVPNCHSRWTLNHEKKMIGHILLLARRTISFFLI